MKCVVIDLRRFGLALVRELERGGAQVIAKLLSQVPPDIVDGG